MLRNFSLLFGRYILGGNQYKLRYKYICMVINSDYIWFIIYSTGCLIFKVFNFGQFVIEFKDFAAFKGSKSKKVKFVIYL